MSLLLEALKKAELAKQGQAQDEPVHAPLPQTIDFPKVELMLDEPEPMPPPEPPITRQTVITRESLPDITQPLEIRSEDLAEFNEPVTRSRGAPPPPPQPAEPLVERTRASEPDSPVEAQTAQQQRDAARQMFEVKEIEYNPRRPFYFTVAGLIIAGACYGGYVWWQMQPHYAVNTAAVKAPAATAVTAAPPVAQSTALLPADAPATAPLGITAAAASAPSPAAASAPAAADGSRRKPAADGNEVLKGSSSARRAIFTPAALDTTAGSARTRANPVRGAARPETTTIAITPAAAQLDPAIERAYSLYQRGDIDGARIDYQRAIERDPLNRDALLGLAAIDVRSRNFDTAELRYLKLLELNPRDTFALGALIGLQGNVDAVQSESRIKSLVAGQPEATHLYFTLGNLYGSQSRWPEAQDAYFKAYSADPENADYAFNLAVSLDQLRQRKPAAEYYRKAAALAAVRPAGFDRNLAETRARELDR